MTEHQPRILFVSLTDDIGSERIVSEMGRRGAECAVVSRPGAVASLSVHAVQFLALPAWGGLWAAALGVRRQLEAMARTWRPDAVVPLDDMAASLLRDLAVARRTGSTLRALLDRSLGDARHYATACCRERLIETAASLGLRTAAQRPAPDLPAAAAAATALGYPLMLKREQTCGGSGVTLVRTHRELVASFRAASRKAGAKRALRRLFGFGQQTCGTPLSLQAHVDGRLAMRTVACEAGQVLEGISFLAERLDPPVTGSSTVVRPIHHPEMDETARRLVAALGCSGFVSFDFIVAADGAAFLIEMNARPVGSGHLGWRFGHDVYGSWLRRFPGFCDRQTDESFAEDCRVALFPKEMARDPDSRSAAAGSRDLHDVPWDEPEVLAHYREVLRRRHPERTEVIDRRLVVACTGDLRRESQSVFGELAPS